MQLGAGRCAGLADPGRRPARRRVPPPRALPAPEGQGAAALRAELERVRHEHALTVAEANLVFQVISKRYEKGSIILTSNKAFSEWGQVFGYEVLATAILDRLLHHCEVVAINGPSYRLKNRLKAIERETEVA
ncbi:hypothetical protein ASD51_31095 [Streptomyces sp. Root55]|nr:hypothetical protein ASD51_31095 [Streptomyces sp. Root55]